MALTYSNPRIAATIENWPYSSVHFQKVKRTTAHFNIETHQTRGQRGVRIVVNPDTGANNRPKKLKYVEQAKIVDGNNGKIYIAELSGYGYVTIMCGNMKDIQELTPESSPRYAVLLELFD